MSWLWPTRTCPVAEIEFTAFTSRRKAEHITARLVVRRVKRLQPRSQGDGTEQGELFSTYRYHAFFTDSALSLLEADKTHRAHAIIEQVIADLKNGPLAHLPSGNFNANAVWLVLAAIAFNLTRAAGCLASRLHARATTGTLRTQLINVPARLARSARRLALHLPQRWPWQDAFEQLFTAQRGHRPRDLTARRKAQPRAKWKSRTDRRLPHAHAHVNNIHLGQRASTTDAVDPG